MNENNDKNNNATELVQTLFAHNSEQIRAGIDVPDAMGQTALLRACRDGNAAIVKQLLEHGADPNLQYGVMRNTALFDVAYQTFREQPCGGAGFVEVARLLLEHGADPALCGPSHRMTPLMMAAKSGFGAMVALLLQQSPPLDVNAQDARGCTALYVAARQRGDLFIDVVRMLLRHGADPSIATTNGFTLARVVKEPAIQELLAVFGGDV